MSYFANAFDLIIHVVLDALLALFLLRLFAERWRVDFHNPFSQFIYKYSNPVLVPVRRHLRNWHRWNIAALLLAWILEIIKSGVSFALHGFTLHIPGVLLLALGELIDFALIIYVVLVFAWALSSFLAAQGNYSSHPAMQFINQLVEPAIQPLRRHVPPLGGIDFSPTVAILLLLLARILIAAPIIDAGRRVALAGLQGG